MARMKQYTFLSLIVLSFFFMFTRESIGQEAALNGRRGVPVLTSSQEKRNAQRQMMSFEGKRKIQPNARDNAKVPTGAEERLALAGLPTTTSGILNWLNAGLNSGQDLTTQYSEKLPKERTQLGVDAIAVLGMKRSNTCVPILVEICTGRLPLGLTQLVEIDIMNTVSDEREPFRTQVVRIYKYNAAIALGDIGDNRALPVVISAFQNEASPSAKMQIALSVALLGSSDSLDWLVSIIGSEDKRIGFAASRMFYFITGQDFGLTLSNSNKKRKAIIPKYTDWWNSNKNSFIPDQVSIRARRSTPPLETRNIDNSLRGQLKMCTNYADFKNFEKITQIRENLKNRGSSINRELEGIIFDDMEDVDVRMEALNIYYDNNTHSSQGRAGIKKYLDKAMRLNDSEVAEKAKLLKLSMETDYKMGNR